MASGLPRVDIQRDDVNVLAVAVDLLDLVHPDRDLRVAVPVRPGDADAVGENPFEVTGVGVADHPAEAEVRGWLRHDGRPRTVVRVRLRLPEDHLEYAESLQRDRFPTAIGNELV